MIIRDCKADDYKDITALNIQLGYEYDAEKTKEKLQRIINDPRNIILVAEENGKAVGYIHAVDYLLCYSSDGMNVMGLVVLEPYRRQGIATALIAELERRAKEKGYEYIRLNSSSYRLPAHAFYRRQGYESSKMQLNFYKEL